MTTDPHITAQIQAYLADGLDEAERRAFDAHLAGCGECAAAFEAARADDARLADAFSAAMPFAGFEDRLIGALRSHARPASLKMRLSRPILHPAIRRIATGVAAAIVVGAVGYGMSIAVAQQAAAEPVADGPATVDAYRIPTPGEPVRVTTDDGKLIKLFDSGMTTDGRRSLGRFDQSRDLDDRTAATLDLKQRAEGEASNERSYRERNGELHSSARPFYAVPARPAAENTSAAPQAAPTATTGMEKGGSAAALDGPVALGMNFSDTPDVAHSADFNLQRGDANGARDEGFIAPPGQPGAADGKNTESGVVSKTEGVSELAKGQSDGDVQRAAEKDTKSNRGWSETVDTQLWYRPSSEGAAAGVGGELEKLPKQLEAKGKTEPSLDVNQGRSKEVSVPDGGTLLLGGQTVAGQAANGKQSVDLDVPLLPEVAQTDKTVPDVNRKNAGPIAGKALAGDAPGKGSTAKPADSADPADPSPSNAGSESLKKADPTVATGRPASAVNQAADPQQEPARQSRKIIRNGNVAFEVDSFDSSLVQVTKIAQEEGGFVATTSSAKLPNGKVSGSVTVRVPPDRLDTVVLKLRGIGDLKNQRIGAEDVTKRYTDIESQLRAATAMEERLLTIIKNGGEVKDLLEAEKQLGVWREKLEVLKGEIKYYDNLISLSTLVVELMERDVRTPTAAFEVETVNTAVETEEVETARAEVLKAIEQAKGRVIDSDLRKLEAGQLSSTIVATVAPDAAGPVIDRLKQLGKLARLDISRKTLTEGGTGPIVPGLRIEKKETRFEIHLYNLANIEPRQTTSLTVAAQDVETTFKQIIDQVRSAGGSIKTSQLNRPKPEQTSATIVFQVTADKADVVLGAIRAGVDVLRIDVAINPDTQNTTEAKRGFSVQIASLAQIPARETTTLQVAAANVPAGFRELLEAASGGGARVLNSQLNEQDANNVTGQLEFEVSREKWSAIDNALREAGAVISRNVVRSNDTENTVDSKIRLSISLIDEIRLAPRETINATVATRTVPETFTTLLQSAKDVGARVVGSNLNLADRANPNGSIRFATPRENAAKFEQAMKDAGLVTSRAIARLPDGPMTVENKVGYVVTVIDERTLRPRESQSMVVVAASASKRYEDLLDALRETDALVLNSQLSVQNKNDITGTLEFVVDRQNRARIEKALAENADVFNRTIDRSQDTQGTVDTKLRYGVTIKEADQQPPKQTFTLGVETSNIDKAVGDLETAAMAVGGRRIEAERTRGDRRDTARVAVDVPLARVAEVIASVRGQGEVTVNQSQQNENVPEGSLSRARVAVAFSTPATVATEKTFGESLREGMSGALSGLFKVVQWVIFGLVVVVPCLLLVWLCYLVIRMSRPRKKRSDVAPPSDTLGTTPNPT